MQQLDLADLENVRVAATRIAAEAPKINFFVLNAGVCGVEYALTKQGLETHIGELDIAGASSLPVQGATPLPAESHELEVIVPMDALRILVPQVALATLAVSCCHQMAD